ncbi:hypothetical protein FOL47_000465 [Perkinsus chesapeaki]|uniref:Uncharacterized protein n=1 Tax=Perkinsus chesapeaki TaxID=330153 RepID=A0A7J6MLY2_PERCH|nr:hypothetical protein FOL47_000465 [Perkinsus chesapeaki]
MQTHHSRRHMGTSLLMANIIIVIAVMLLDIPSGALAIKLNNDNHVVHRLGSQLTLLPPPPPPPAVDDGEPEGTPDPEEKEDSSELGEPSEENDDDVVVEPQALPEDSPQEMADEDLGPDEPLRLSSSIDEPSEANDVPTSSTSTTTTTTRSTTIARPSTTTAKTTPKATTTTRPTTVAGKGSDKPSSATLSSNIASLVYCSALVLPLIF